LFRYWFDEDFWGHEKICFPKRTWACDGGVSQLGGLRLVT